MNIHRIKNVNPNMNVTLLINNSGPLSLRLENNSESPVVSIMLADAALPLCNKTIAINKIDIITTTVSIIVSSLIHFTIYSMINQDN